MKNMKLCKLKNTKYKDGVCALKIYAEDSGPSIKTMYIKVI